MADTDKIVKKLAPLEIKVLPFLEKNSSLSSLTKASGLKEVEVMRALQWLENKEVLKTKVDLKQSVELDKNGTNYARFGLPEKRLLAAIKDKEKDIDAIQKETGLEKVELNIGIGVLKQKAAILMKPGMIISITEQGKKELSKESLEEKLLKRLEKEGIDLASLAPEERFAYDNLRKRREIIKTVVAKERIIELTELGKKIAKIKISAEDFIDRLTPESIKSGKWKKAQFRGYDVSINVPKVHGGKRHFVAQSIEYAKRIWTDLGFKEMEGPLLNTSFWNFDALFTAQDHPVREMQDTFFIKNPATGKLPDKKIVEAVKKAHESGVKGSKGWQYEWDPEEAMKNVLRTHTTVLSSRTIAALKKSELPAKFFAVGRCFRNETVDWKHLFEFNQTEGIVIDPDANFRHLLGYLKEFFKKMGFPKARFRPAHFPYTEPSIEIDVYHPVRNEWVELGGAGMFRPEVVVPLLGEDIPVLAWGPGFDRIMTEFYKIQDLRDLYSNNLDQIRSMKFWNK